MLLTTLSPLLLLVAKVSAAGCKGSMTYGFCEPDRIVRYYDPEDGQICPMRDCGGGRAPPKTTDPCCGFYKGTETCNPNPPPTYLPCFSQLKASSAGSKPTSASASATTTPLAPSSTPVLTRSSPGSSAPTPSATSSGAEATQSSASSSGSEAPQSTAAPPAAGGNGTVTTSAPNGASSGSPSSSAAAPAQNSNAAGALRYDLMGAIAGFVGVNAFALV